jgi:hypothetical protein
MSSGTNSPASSSANDGAKGGASGDGGATDGDGGKPGKGSAAWCEEEIEAIKSELRTQGRNWAAVSSKISNKTAEQCKKFYFDNRKKHGLDKIILEFKRVSKFFQI